MQDAAPETELLKCTKPEDGIAVLTLARPASRNALSLAMLEAVTAAMDELSSDSGVKAIVLTAEGPVFCAGHDLRELTARRGDADGGREFYEQTMATCARTMQ
jgi:enoyl-CoA hydratase/carnithine racemase